ncbi:unnamed protein product [Rotaria sp. Silwood1]|nr:unnamed protein product [Rotaria sp. Silwood1]CAF1084242.1 unnamed protein product [Rotaria sp. Silwood1]CAF3445365.1 unnamed protein product [Rotaria sp. Silwood1]
MVKLIFIPKRRIAMVFILLKRQEEYYQAKLIGLRSILISTHYALKNVTDVVNELTKMSSGTSSNAPIDRLHMH